MGRGSIGIRRWQNDRQRAKKLREKRKTTERGSTRKSSKTK